MIQIWDMLRVEVGRSLWYWKFVTFGLRLKNEAVRDFGSLGEYVDELLEVIKTYQALYSLSLSSGRSNLFLSSAVDFTFVVNFSFRHLDVGQPVALFS